MADHLRAGGTLPPIIISPSFEIRDGNHRLLGHILAGRIEIDAEVES